MCAHACVHAHACTHIHTHHIHTHFHPHLYMHPRTHMGVHINTLTHTHYLYIYIPHIHIHIKEKILGVWSIGYMNFGEPDSRTHTQSDRCTPWLPVYQVHHAIPHCCFRSPYAQDSRDRGPGLLTWLLQPHSWA